MLKICNHLLHWAKRKRMLNSSDTFNSKWFGSAFTFICRISCLCRKDANDHAVYAVLIFYMSIFARIFCCLFVYVIWSWAVFDLHNYRPKSRTNHSQIASILCKSYGLFYLFVATMSGVWLVHFQAQLYSKLIILFQLIRTHSEVPHGDVSIRALHGYLRHNGKGVEWVATLPEMLKWNWTESIEVLISCAVWSGYTGYSWRTLKAQVAEGSNLYTTCKATNTSILAYTIQHPTTSAVIPSNITYTQKEHQNCVPFNLKALEFTSTFPKQNSMKNLYFSNIHRFTTWET